MIGSIGTQLASDVLFCSSLKDNVWHNLAGPNAFESWHFDAVSDDGREALVVAFYDNYVLSPRFTVNSSTSANVTRSGRHRFPAISFVYAIDGKPVFDTICEFVDGDFSSSTGRGCSIGASSFRTDVAEYGAGSVLKIDLLTYAGRRIQAELEWLFIESNLSPAKEHSDGAVWNAVVPRADVSGKIQLISRRGKLTKTVQFRGTGYHDQVTSSNVHYRDLSSRMWGRAHFVDATVVFDRLGGVQNWNAPGKLYLIRDGDITQLTSDCHATGHRRNRWGLLVPGEIVFNSGDAATIHVKPVSAFRSGPSEIKMLSEISLYLPDGKVRKSIGVTEFVDPSRLRKRLFRWISDLKIGREDKSPVL